MTYIDEISRLTKTTASGTTYTEVKLNPFGVADAMLLCIPSTTKGVLMICAHGHNGTEDTINASRMIETRDLAIDQGWLVASSYAHGNAWANDTGLADYRRVYDWSAAHFDIKDVLLHGQSMGGLTVMNIQSRQSIPNIRATVSIDGALSLQTAYNSGSYKPAIQAAYGIASDGSDYSAKTAGHDAVLLTPSTFTGTRMLIEASPNDTAIPKVSHSDVFYQNMSGRPVDFRYLVGAGTHTADQNYFGTEVMKFYRTSLGIAEAPVFAHKLEAMWYRNQSSLVQVDNYMPTAPGEPIVISSHDTYQDVSGTVSLTATVNNSLGSVSRVWFTLGKTDFDATGSNGTYTVPWDTTISLTTGEPSPSNYLCWITAHATIDGVTYDSTQIAVYTANYDYGSLPTGGWNSSYAFAATYTDKTAWLNSYGANGNDPNVPDESYAEGRTYGSGFATVEYDPTVPVGQRNASTRKAVRAAMPNDPQGAIQPTNSPRFQAQSPGVFNEGAEFYIGFSIYVPTVNSSTAGSGGFPSVNVSDTPGRPTGKHIAIFQMYGEQSQTPDAYPTGRGAITIIDANRRVTGDPVDMFHIEGNQLNGGDPDLVVEFPYNRGGWTDIVLGFHMSADVKKGWIEVYLNQGDYSTVQPVPLFGGLYRLPRVTAWPITSTPTVPDSYENGELVTGGSRKHRTDMQIYRSPTAYDEVTLYHTAHKVGSTPASVDPKSYQ